MICPAPAASTHRPRLQWLALWTGLLPFIVINLAYLGSVLGGHIASCIPYIAGCTSISSAGRYGLSYYFFKAGMLPAAMLLAGFWILCRRWLIELGDDNGAMVRCITVLGVLAAAFLSLYTVFLGSSGDFYNLMRRFGVTLYFGFSGLAQIMLLARLRRLRAAGAAQIPNPLLRLMLLLLLALLIVGLASIPISNFIVDKHRPRNIVEWNFALLMIGYYVLIWRAWRATGFHPGVDVARLPGTR
ncbi:MAG: hypothetical protein E2O52_05685 [Gammaproteobacteria bacterium]|nr:MAG: hypothetical protein E2O52_05685 [Gammaproteobacteria bacterium]